MTNITSNFLSQCKEKVVTSNLFIWECLWIQVRFEIVVFQLSIVIVWSIFIINIFPCTAFPYSQELDFGYVFSCMFFAYTFTFNFLHGKSTRKLCTLQIG
jgi:hypothetical protein